MPAGQCGHRLQANVTTAAGTTIPRDQAESCGMVVTATLLQVRQVSRELMSQAENQMGRGWGWGGPEDHGPSAVVSCVHLVRPWSPSERGVCR